jgi:hypothetical protein
MLVWEVVHNALIGIECSLVLTEMESTISNPMNDITLHKIAEKREYLETIRVDKDHYIKKKKNS